MNYWEKKSDYKSSDYRSINFSGKWTKHFINNYIDSLFSVGIDNTNQIFHEYKKEHLPENLYKFFPPTLYSLIGLQSQTIYLSSPRNFNDPFDSFVCIETDTFTKLYLLKELKSKGLVSDNDLENNISKEEYWKIYYSWSNEENMPYNIYHPARIDFRSIISEICQSKSETFRKLIEQIKHEAQIQCAEKIDNIRNMQFKISCFSNFQDEAELLENTTMWSHYADNHHGFCVKYTLDFEKLRNKADVLCGMFPISYTSITPKLSPRELMRLQYKNGQLKLNKSILKTTYKALTTKSRFWNYEKEWRLIVSEQNSEYILNNTIPFLAIATIYLGCRMESNLKKNLILFAEKNGIEVYQTLQSNEKFKLDIVHRNLKTLKDEELFERLSKIQNIENASERLNKTFKVYEDDGLTN